MSTDRAARKALVQAAIQTEDQDHEQYLKMLKARTDAAGIAPSSVHIRFQNLTVEASIYVGNRSEPTVTNTYRNFFEGLVRLTGLIKDNRNKFTILDNISGEIKPGRMTLLLGPPGGGKSVLLKTLGSKMKQEGCKITGQVSYNGLGFSEFVPELTAAYIEQTDLHFAELTVHETLDFAARVQGIGHRAEEFAELREAEKAAGRIPDPDVDALMEAETIRGARESVVTEYMLKLLGLDVCADTVVGSDMIRGVSGGQKRRVTSAEMLVSAKSVILADEISTGLDSSTAFLLSKALRDFCHLKQATVLTALLQPQPESYDLFDDVLLMAEGSIIFHGPREQVVPFFESCGFRCPERKGVPDFLQEVTSKKDQGQYWIGSTSYRYVPVLEFVDAFEKSEVGRARAESLAAPFDRVSLPGRDPLIYNKHALSSMEVMKACLSREYVLFQRNAFVYKFKAVQMSIVAIINALLFLRTHIHRETYEDANLHAGFLFFTLIQLFFSALAEMTFTIMRLPVFFKQRDNLFYPTWAFVLPTTLVRLPVSFFESLIWVVITYFAVGLTLDASRVFVFWLICFLIHNMAITIFRTIGALARNLVVANALGALVLLTLLLLGGFVLSKHAIHPWWIWGYWASPIAFAQRSLLINEFSSAHWQSVPAPDGSPGGMGVFLLTQKNFQTAYWWVWVGIGAMAGYTLLFNFLIVLAHQYLDPYETATAVMSEEALAEREHARRGHDALEGMTHSANGAAEAVVVIEEEEPIKPSDLAADVDVNEVKGLPTKTPSRIANRRTQSAAQLRAARTQRLLDLSQRQLAHSREAQASRKSLGASERSMSSRRSLQLTEANVESGMVLPFEPMTMTFQDVNYFVPLPPEMAGQTLPAIKDLGNTKMLQLLNGISGAFRPGVLTALMGVSGAGKTTLMDVLAGRKTGGVIEGDIRINGHPKVQDTFARISGYCEQTDVHSPQTSVVEALLFSAKLRINDNIDTETLAAYVDEVMDLVELNTIRSVIVGTPGVSGLSVEQRKRLTIAVELVANPSIIFMDEPTSGLGAREAAIVMRAVRNIGNTNRTIVCTIHQPSIDIFESFDELLLLKRGGRTIYAGSLGKDSSKLVAYLSAVPGVPPIKSGINPATWMLEVSTPGMEERLKLDLADVYEQSPAAKATRAVIEEASTPAEGSEPLFFDTVYPRSFLQQVKICFAKFWVTYWRTPEYNATRFSFTVGVALVLGTVFWKLGADVSTEQSIFNVLGALFTSSLFLGILNAIFVQPVMADERAVMYRERGAGIYAVIPWFLGLTLVELIYLLGQGGLYTCVVYFMCGFQKNAGKFFWFMFFTDTTLIYFSFYGIAAVAITPNVLVAAVFSSAFYTLFNLFAGFVVQQRNVPGWLLWMFWADPVNWTLRGLLDSQLGNIVDEPVLLAVPVGEVTNPKEFIFTMFAYESGWLAYVAVVLLAFCMAFILVAAFGLKKLNFQNR